MYLDATVHILHGSTANVAIRTADRAFARDVLEQCCIKMRAYKGLKRWKKSETIAAIGKDLDVRGYDDKLVPTFEELLLTRKQSTTVLNIYYVKSLDGGDSDGEAFPRSKFRTPPFPAVILANPGKKGVHGVLAHEIGHILLDSTLHLLGKKNEKNLMHKDSVDPKLLTPKQCRTIRKHPLLSVAPAANSGMEA